MQAVARGVQKLVIRLPSQDPPPDEISFGGPALRILRDAQKTSKEGGDTFIGTVHLVQALLSDSQLSKITTDAGCTAESIKQAVANVRAGKKVDSASAEEGFEALKKYCTDLTALAREGKLDPVIAREDELRRVIRVLSRRTKSNPVLIGEAGVGKTAVAELLAQRIVDRDVPVNLLATLYSLDMGALMAGASYKGQYEERVKSVIDELEAADNAILFVDEMHLLLAGKDSGGGMDAANLLKPALARGKLRVIGATTLAEYRKYIEKDLALTRRFAEIQVLEPDVPSTISILRGIREKYELHHGVAIADAALVQAAQLAHRYLTQRKLPDSAIDLVDEACAAVRVARDSQPEAIDVLVRQRTQLEIEIHALEREHEKAKDDTDIADRLEAARTARRKVDDELDPLQAEYDALKSRADDIQAVREKIESLRNKADRAERENDIATASDIRYYSVPDQLAKLEKLEALKKSEDASRRSILGSDEVNAEAIAEIVSRWTGIPASSLKQSEREKLLKMEKILSREVIGQPQAVKAVANAIRLSRSGLSNPNRPTGSFLFSGSSGTGKTQLAKSLAKFLFQDEQAMVRIDASEFSEKHSVSKLLGPPPGYVGFDSSPGVLTEAVRRKPYCVILVDELEKACREFQTLFLGILDDGRATSSAGVTVDFKNTIIIMTTNLGSAALNDLPADANITPEVEEKVQDAIRAFLLPEFLNRIDSICVFSRLGQKQIVRIVEVRLAEVQKRLDERKIRLEVDDDAKRWLGAASYNPAYGARPLNRMIQSELLNPLSKLLLNDRIRDGETVHVTADFQANRLVIKPNHASAVPEDEEMDVDLEELDEEDLD